MSKTAIQPRWLSYKDARTYSSFSIPHLEVLVRQRHIESKNVRLPGSSRGRRLIDRLSLDKFIEDSSDEPAALVMNRKNRSSKSSPVPPAPEPATPPIGL